MKSLGLCLDIVKEAGTNSWSYNLILVSLIYLLAWLSIKLIKLIISFKKQKN